MKKSSKFALGLALLMTVAAVKYQKNKKGLLSGVYKETSRDVLADDAGRPQYNYFYFKEDGTALLAQPETADQYGDAGQGTWEYLGNDQFQVKIKSIYDHNFYQLEMTRSGKGLTTPGTVKNAPFEWEADSYQQDEMVVADFMDMFNQAKKSQQEKVAKNGYDVPENER